MLHRTNNWVGQMILDAMRRGRFPHGAGSNRADYRTPDVRIRAAEAKRQRRMERNRALADRAS